MHLYRFGGVIFTCANKLSPRMPVAVSLVSSEDTTLSASNSGLCGTLPNLLLVRRTLPVDTHISPRGDILTNTSSSSTARRESRERFAVCVTPLNLHYEQPDSLLAMLEFNRLLGARHVFFYNHSVGARSGALLERYRSGEFADTAPQAASDNDAGGGGERTRGTFGVSVVQWPVPVRVHQWPPQPGYEEEVHYFAQSTIVFASRLLYLISYLSVCILIIQVFIE